MIDRTAVLRLAAVVWIAASGCAAAGNQSRDSGPAAVDAGPLANGPLPTPLLRMDDGAYGRTHTKSYQGVVTNDGPGRTVPAVLGNITPAKQLDFQKDSSSTTQTLFFTLPTGFFLTLFPNDQIKLTYAELAQSYGSSYGVRVEDLSGNLKMLAEDGLVGLALTDRLGFDFQLDTQQPTLTETVECGQKVHYPVIVSQDGVKRQVYPGAATVFTVGSADLNFTLFDAYRILNATCPVPDFSIAYIVQPRS